MVDAMGGKGTITGGLPEFTPPKDERTEQQKCEDKGGFWDVERQTCLLVPPKEEPKPAEPQADITTPEVFTDQATGQVSGITLPDGRTFFGLSPDEVAAIAGKETGRGVPPPGTAPVGTAQAQAQEAQRKIITAKNVGKIDLALASQLEEEGLNVKEYLAAGGHGAIKQALSWGATAAGAGLVAGPAAPVTVPVAGALGAGIGLVKGFYSDVTANMEAQRQDLVSTKTKELKQRKTAITRYISSANANPAAADEYVAAMNLELSLIRKDYNTLLKRGNEDLEFWGTDATPQLVEYKVFFDSTEPSLIGQMQQAVLKPNPTRAFIDIEEEEL